MIYYDYEIKDILEYLKFILNYSEKNQTELWFRGHRSSSWNLRPSLFREEVLDMPNDGGVYLFRYKNFINFFEAIKNFRKNLRKELRIEENKDKFNLFHYTFLAQHYGMPTNALDWTTDPLVALYFAVDKFDISIIEDDFPVVYILNPSRLNKISAICYDRNQNKEIKKPFCIDDLEDSKFIEWFSDMNNTPFSIVPFAVNSKYDLHSHRISRQSGVFTLHEARYYRGQEWINFTDNQKEPIGIAIKISASSVTLIRNQLKVLNITEETIYGKEKSKLEYYAKKVTLETPYVK